MAIPGFSVSGALDATSRTIQGAVEAVAPSRFQEIAGGVASGLTGELSRQINSRVDQALGGADNRQALERALQGDIGAVRDRSLEIIGSQFGSDASAAAERILSGDIRGGLDQALTVAGQQSLTQFFDGIIAGEQNAKARGGNRMISSWGGLSPHLIAQFYALKLDGTVDTSQQPVYGPITDATFEATLNWQSPFENAGPESKAPALMALIQTGQIGVVANALQAVLPPELQALTNSATEDLQAIGKSLEGRTGITKLNSRQVFSGMPPIKIPLTIHFRAVTDPRTEVIEPYQRLLGWSLPKSLAKDGVLPAVLGSGSVAELVKNLFPSEAPTLIGLRYANEKFAPLVIESLSRPIDGPRGEDGKPLYFSVQLQLSTLTALDRNDVVNLMRY